MFNIKIKSGLVSTTGTLTLYTGFQAKNDQWVFFCLASVSNGIGMSTMRQLANNWHTQIYWKIDNVGCMAKIFLIMHSNFHILAISRLLIQFNNRKSETFPQIIAWKLKFQFKIVQFGPILLDMKADFKTRPILEINEMWYLINVHIFNFCGLL